MLENPSRTEAGLEGPAGLVFLVGLVGGMRCWVGGGGGGGVTGSGGGGVALTARCPFLPPHSSSPT